ncbi:MAG: hypothetical protein RIC55_03115 [Pirellulaceae bacterium]
MPPTLIEFASPPAVVLLANAAVEGSPPSLACLLASAAAWLLLLLAIWQWQRYRTRQIIRWWAQHRGYTLLGWHSTKSPLTKIGPAWRGELIYRVTVADGSGRQREGWVKIGGLQLGSFDDAKVKEMWDPPAG